MRNLLLTLLLLLPMTLAAQHDLAVGKVLDGRYKKNVHTTDVEISGERLSEYRLIYYHSLTVTDDTAIMDAIATAVMADEAKAINKEVSTIGARLYYGFFQMTDDNSKLDGIHRYIFFRDMRVAKTGSQPMVSIIYMEGPASLNFLKSKFQK